MIVKVSASIEWSFEGDQPDQFLKKATEELSLLLSSHMSIVDVKCKILASPQTQHNEILGVFSVDDVLPHTVDFHLATQYKEFAVGDKTYSVKMNSHRYTAFKKDNCKCAACGLEGTKFVLERQLSNGRPHFNLYGEDKETGELVLMTKDHIYPASRLGISTHENFQTMCITCNNLKAHHLLTIEDVVELRKIHDEARRNKLGRKEAAKLVSDKQAELAKPESIIPPGVKIGGKRGGMKKAKFKSKERSLVVNCNLSVIDEDDKPTLRARGDGDERPFNADSQVAVIPHQTILKPSSWDGGACVGFSVAELKRVGINVEKNLIINQCYLDVESDESRQKRKFDAMDAV